MNILIVLALLGLCAGGVNRAVGESLALLQTSGDLDSMHGAGLFVFVPGRTGDVSADNCLNRKNAQLAHLHTTVLQDRAQGLRNLGREIEGNEMGAQGGVGLGQSLEPCLRAESEEDALAGDAL
jgi:hypothetical protein